MLSHIAGCLVWTYPCREGLFRRGVARGIYGVLRIVDLQTFFGQCRSFHLQNGYQEGGGGFGPKAVMPSNTPPALRELTTRGRGFRSA